VKRKRLVFVEEQIATFIEGNGMRERERQNLCGANGGEFWFDGFGRDLVRQFAAEAEDDSAVGAVAAAGQRELPVETGFNAGGFFDYAGLAQAGGKSCGSAHGADRMRTRRADADLEKFEETGFHGSATNYDATLTGGEEEKFCSNGCA